MAECDISECKSDLIASEICNAKCHPTYSSAMSTVFENTLLKSTSKQLPNGMSRILPGSNGLNLVSGELAGNLVANVDFGMGCLNLSGDMKTAVPTEICDSNISNSVNIYQLTSNFDCISVSDSVEDRDMLNGIKYVTYKSELQMPDIMRLITKDLSEPYSIYTYRYFIHNWPKLCFLAMDGEKCVGAVVCKLDMHKKMVHRGYIAMLAIDSDYRRKKIGSHLVLKAIRAMIADNCDEVVLETEITNQAALQLYKNLGFVRDKRLFRYYLNGVDALRLKLWLR